MLLAPPPRCLAPAQLHPQRAAKHAGAAAGGAGAALGRGRDPPPTPPRGSHPAGAHGCKGGEVLGIPSSAAGSAAPRWLGSRPHPAARRHPVALRGPQGDGSWPFTPLWPWCSAPLPVPPAKQPAGRGIFAFPEHLPRAWPAQYRNSASQPRREPGQSTAPLRPGGKLRHGGGWGCSAPGGGPSPPAAPRLVGTLQGQQDALPLNHP